jgi:hypothetical protein
VFNFSLAAAVLLFFAPPLWAEDLLVLPPVIVKGTATDLILVDQVSPQTHVSHGFDGSSGSSVKALEENLSLPVSQYGSGAPLSQFKGLGRSVEDTNVQTLGVPLNLPQGGGFDFSTFPQFFWASYRFQAGAGLGAYDPRAVSGTLTLTPWTYETLSLERAGIKTSFFSNTS